MHKNIATLSKQFGITDTPRLVETSVWFVGWVNGHRMYYTDTPSNIRSILESDPRAFFVYGNACKIGRRCWWRGCCCSVELVGIALTVRFRENR